MRRIARKALKSKGEFHLSIVSSSPFNENVEYGYARVKLTEKVANSDFISLKLLYVQKAC